MTKSRDELIALVAKLHAKAIGAADIGNQAEAEAFAAKVQTLLLEHKLSLSEVELRDEAAADPLGWATYDPVARGLDPAGSLEFRSRIGWLEQLGMAVAGAHVCRFIVTANAAPGRLCFIFIGRKLDVELAGYVFTVLGQAGYRLSGIEYRAAKRAGRDTRGWYRTFQTAYARAIRDRYATALRELEARQRGLGRGTALVRLATERAAVERFADQAFRTVQQRATGMATSNDYAAERGAHHGQAANLNATGLGGRAAGQPRLGAPTKALPPGRGGA